MDFQPHGCCVCGAAEHRTVAYGRDWQYRTVDRSFSWATCLHCGHFYVTEIPQKAEVGRLYPVSLKNYEDFDRNPGVAFRVKAYLDGRSFRRISKHLPPGSSLLDVGCASGMFLDAVRAYCPNFTRLEGVEISPEAGRVAERKGYHVHKGLIEDVESGATYDAIVLQQVIEHVFDPVETLAKLWRMLKPGGLLMMETPSLDCLDRALFRGYWEGYHIPRHFNIWTEQGMGSLLAKAGFVNFRVERKIKPVHWTLSLQNLALERQWPRFALKFFDLRNPVLLAGFGIIDLLQLVLFRKSSDVRYLATRP